MRRGMSAHRQERFGTASPERWPRPKPFWILPLQPSILKDNVCAGVDRVAGPARL